MHSAGSEESLIKQAVQHDREAFANLYDRYVDYIYKHVYYLVSNKSDAEDITQEVFIKAWKAIHKYDNTRGHFVAWLIRIARNLVADYYRAKKKEGRLVELEASSQTGETNPDAITEASLNRSHVRKAILKLKEEKQKVILMHFVDGFSYKEIAKVLNKSEGAVRVIQYRALNDLKRMLIRTE
jgi:RNA polymerase sigma-70 factor (ECF subfamily)